VPIEKRTKIMAHRFGSDKKKVLKGHNVFCPSKGNE
jgi:hypothetical protein